MANKYNVFSMANKLSDILNGTFIIILILIIYIFYYRKQKQKEFDTIDSNKDGKISDTEVLNYFRRKMKHKKNYEDLTKTFIMGGFRGFLMGFILGGVDNALMMSLVLGCVNVLMYEVESIN
jgi:RsiW-degrading membrane proteinase PrsW (M82 family)